MTPSFLDVETTSLSADMGMLVCSVIRSQGRDLVFFVDTPRNERRVLDRLSTRLSRCDALVTFNGKYFDLPFLLSRGLILGARHVSITTARHLDLFEYCKQILRFEKLSLDHIAKILGIEVETNMTGREIPHLYLAYLASRNKELRGRIIAHCISDVATLEKLYLKLEPLLAKEGLVP